MKTKILREKATALENELADLYAMSEEAACFRYNVDYKQEAIDILNDELQDAYKALEEAELEVETKEYTGWCDPAFRSVADFDRTRI
jgi:hypothetical protein